MARINRPSPPFFKIQNTNPLDPPGPFLGRNKRFPPFFLKGKKSFLFFDGGDYKSSLSFAHGTPRECFPPFLERAASCRLFPSFLRFRADDLFFSNTKDLPDNRHDGFQTNEKSDLDFPLSPQKAPSPYFPNFFFFFFVGKNRPNADKMNPFPPPLFGGYRFLP